jgi:hypothetical protein
MERDPYHDADLAIRSLVSRLFFPLLLLLTFSQSAVLLLDLACCKVLLSQLESLAVREYYVEEDPDRHAAPANESRCKSTIRSYVSSSY